MGEEICMHFGTYFTPTHALPCLTASMAYSTCFRRGNWLEFHASHKCNFSTLIQSEHCALKLEHRRKDKQALLKGNESAFRLEKQICFEVSGGSGNSKGNSVRYVERRGICDNLVQTALRWPGGDISVVLIPKHSHVSLSFPSYRLISCVQKQILGVRNERNNSIFSQGNGLWAKWHLRTCLEPRTSHSDVKSGHLSMRDTQIANLSLQKQRLRSESVSHKGWKFCGSLARQGRR